MTALKNLGVYQALYWFPPSKYDVLPNLPNSLIQDRGPPLSMISNDFNCLKQSQLCFLDEPGKHSIQNQQFMWMVYILLNISIFNNNFNKLVIVYNFKTVLKNSPCVCDGSFCIPHLYMDMYVYMSRSNTSISHRDIPIRVGLQVTHTLFWVTFLLKIYSP